MYTHTLMLQDCVIGKFDKNQYICKLNLDTEEKLS